MSYDEHNINIMTTSTITPITSTQDGELNKLIMKVRKVIKEANHNELRYPELNNVTTYGELATWINKHYQCFYSVFQLDLLCILAIIPPLPPPSPQI
jgi:hypothetical protein